jgi:hypothetical protein
MYLSKVLPLSAAANGGDLFAFDVVSLHDIFRRQLPKLVLGQRVGSSARVSFALGCLISQIKGTFGNWANIARHIEARCSIPLTVGESPSTNGTRKKREPRRKCRYKPPMEMLGLARRCETLPVPLVRACSGSRTQARTPPSVAQSFPRLCSVFGVKKNKIQPRTPNNPEHLRGGLTARSGHCRRRSASQGQTRFARS